MTPVLVRAQSWPLINNVCQINGAGYDNNPVPQSPQLNGEICLVADQGLCCPYGCSPNDVAGITHNGRSSMSLHHRSSQRMEAFLSRLLYFRHNKRHKNHPNDGSSINPKLLNGLGERKTPAKGVPEILNGASAVNCIKSVIVVDQEKKVETASPSFQQLVMTRRLLCRHYYPEGGWGIVIIIVGVLVQTMTHGLHLSYGVLLLPTSRRFHTPWYHTSKCFGWHGVG